MKYLESNLADQVKNEKGCFNSGKEIDCKGASAKELAKLIEKFEGEMPDIKDVAKKLRIRHQVDPFLTDLMK